MKALILWLVYHPVTWLVQLIPCNLGFSLANLLGDLEHILSRRLRPGFQKFLEMTFSGTSLEGRQEELARQCFRYRHQNFFARVYHQSQSLNLKEVDVTVLEPLQNRGLCLPMCHVGFFFIGFSMLADALPKRLYTLSLMNKKDNRLEDRCIEEKKRMLTTLGSHPVFELDFFKNVCLPEVAAGKAAYIPTFDAVTARSKLYPMLSGEIPLLIEPTAAFALQASIPLVPFFVQSEAQRRVTLKLGDPLDPAQKPSLTPADIADWYRAQLEAQALESPEQIDWFFWWKNTLRFKALTR